MASHSTEAFDGEERDSDPQSRVKEALSTLANRDSNGLAAMIAGGVLLAWTVRTARRNRGRAVLQLIAGAALIGLGVRQRRSRGESRTDDAGADEATESAEARAHLEQSEVLHQSETNPRGTSGEPDVETKTDPDEGSIQFTEEQDPDRTEPNFDEEGARDPRIDADDDDEVEIDLSEAAMADEASEAAGPSPKQAQPSTTEETEPEPTPEEDASHMRADVPDDESADETDDELPTAGSADETDDEGPAGS